MSKSDQQYIAQVHPYLAEFVDMEINMELYENLAKQFIIKYVPTYDEYMNLNKALCSDPRNGEFDKLMQKMYQSIKKFDELKYKTQNLCNFALDRNMLVLPLIPKENIKEEHIIKALEMKCMFNGSIDGVICSIPENLYTKEFLQKIKPFTKKYSYMYERVSVDFKPYFESCLDEEQLRLLNEDKKRWEDFINQNKTQNNFY